jgi:hypothetical protein
LVEISVLRVWRKVADLHVLDHALAKAGHGELLCVPRDGDRCGLALVERLRRQWRVGTLA